MLGRVPTVAVGVVLGLVVPTLAGAGSIQPLGGGQVAVRAQGIPLGQLLQELGALLPLDVVAADPAFLRQPVTVDLERVPLDQAAARILLETGLSFAVGGLKGKPLRVIVGAEEPEMLAAALPRRDDPPRPDPVPGAVEARPRASQLPQRLGAWRMDMKAQQQTGEAKTRARAAAERALESTPHFVADDPDVPGGYVIEGDSVTYNDPNFVPYKNRPEVKAKREATDVSKIP